MPPSGRKNLKPFLSIGRWLAVTMTEPSPPQPSVIRIMYIAGVVHIPTLTTSAPAAHRPFAKAAESSSPVRRESRPI